MSGGIRRARQKSTGLGGGDHIMDNEKDGKPTPIAIVMGMDPLLTLASGSPARPNAGGTSAQKRKPTPNPWKKNR